MLIRELVTLRERVAQLERLLSDHARLVQAARDKEERLSEITGHIAAVLWVYDCQTEERVYVSPSYESIWHRSLDTLLAEPDEWIDAIHPSDRGRFREELAALSGGSSLDVTYRIIRPDGRIRWIRDRGVPILDSSGGTHRSAGIAEDITLQRERDQNAGEADRKWRDLLLNSPDSIAALDLDGKIMFTNRETAGFEIGVRLGAGLKEYLSPDQQNSFSRAVETVARTGEPTFVEARLALPAGNRCWLTRITPVKQGDRVIGMLAVASDHTHRKEQEDAAATARKLESLDLLTGAVAHDFSNLLTVILANTELALTDLPPQALVRKQVREVEQATLRATDLAAELGSWASPQVTECRPVNLSELIQGMAPSLSSAVPSNVGLELALSPDIDAVEVDAELIKQAVMNLVGNAAEAIGDESGEITIRTGLMAVDRDFLATTHVGSALSPGIYGLISISDEGIGMDAASVNRACDPFFTSKPSRRGMGLATVLGIVRAHKGALRIESQLRHGTTVTVLLPLHERPSSDVEIPAEPAENTLERKADRLIGTVLVAEDDATVRAVAKMALEQEGFVVLEAADGRQAVSAFQEQADAIDVVLLDLAMPRMGGEEVLREIRSVRSDVRVVLTSGYNLREISKRFTNQGLDGFLQKPYRHKSLLKEVNRAMKGEGGRPRH
jgi:PAS domain S-box-containing protein